MYTKYVKCIERQLTEKVLTFKQEPDYVAYPHVSSINEQ